MNKKILNTFNNLIEINIKNIPNKFMKIFKLNKCNIKFINQNFS